jgi:hypothetical protein
VLCSCCKLNMTDPAALTVAGYQVLCRRNRTWRFAGGILLAVAWRANEVKEALPGTVTLFCSNGARLLAQQQFILDASIQQS